MRYRPNISHSNSLILLYYILDIILLQREYFCTCSEHVLPSTLCAHRALSRTTRKLCVGLASDLTISYHPSPNTGSLNQKIR